MTDTYTLSVLLFYQAPLICVIVCAYIFITMKRNGLTQKQFHLFRLLTIGCVLAMAGEIISGMILYKLVNRDANSFVNASNFSYSMLLLNTVIFGEFCISRLNSPSRVLCIILRCLYIVIGVVLICRFCLTETGLFTFYDKNGNIEFGPLDDIQTWGYLLCDVLQTAMAAIKLADKDEFVNREKNRKLFFASLIVTAAVLIYVLFYLPYVIWLSYLMAILYLFTGFQSMLIYNDELTSLGNRRRMLRDIREFSRDTNQESKTFGYILIDINSFKQVNDTHGHNEGDRALTIVSSALDLVSRKNDAKAYRIGGDEFAILASLSDEEKAQEICDEISAELHKQAGAEDLPYDLSVSCGYAIYGEGSMTDLSAVMEKADQRMYEIKRREKHSL